MTENKQARGAAGVVNKQEAAPRNQVHGPGGAGKERGRGKKMDTGLSGGVAKRSKIIHDATKTCYKKEKNDGMYKGKRRKRKRIPSPQEVKPMSMLDQFEQEIVTLITKMSQEEGLKDHEIAEKLGYSRATINRKRQTHNIPIADLGNRRDKRCVCQSCGQEYFIRRKERRKKECPACLEKK